MDKSKLQKVLALIDDRLEAIGPERAEHMVRIFELLSASFAQEENRPSVFLHGTGDNILLLPVNVDTLELLDILAATYSKVYAAVIGDKPSKGALH
jgi:hypothetical protein